MNYVVGSGGSKETTYNYDSHGNVRNKIQLSAGVTFTVNYTHDPADNITIIAYPPASGSVHYDLDSMGRVSDVYTAWGGSLSAYIMTGATYMPFGPSSGLTYSSSTDSNRLIETRGYDMAYRLTGIDTKDTTGAHTIQDWSYAYYDDDTILGITDNLTSGNSQSFGYDAMGRITSATGPYGTIVVGTSPSAAYDADGNRNQITINGTTTSYTYGTANDQLASTTVGSTTTNFTYNADGATTSDGIYTYTYQSSNQFSSAKSGSTTLYTDGYDYQGHRVSEQVGGSTVVYVYDESGHLLAELNSSDGSVIKQHIWLGDRPLAYYQVNISGSTSANVKYLHVDQINTPRLMTTSTKVIGWTWNSDPWGNGTTGGTYNPRFPGQYLDSQTGNMQNWFRNYDPRIGRYLESDPIGLGGGINTYTYVLNSPVNLFDPFGLDATNYWNNTGGRNPLTNGPTNGNWGGKCWSGGQFSCDGHQMGNAPPTDSADACYMNHDKCYDKCGLDPVCLMECDQHLVSGLKALSSDPRQWPMPPKSGTEGDSAAYRNAAIRKFSQSPPTPTGPPYYP